MSKPLKKDATYADLCAVPENFVAEILGRRAVRVPAAGVAACACGRSVLGGKLSGPFQRRRERSRRLVVPHRAGVALRCRCRRAGYRRLASRADADDAGRRAFHACARLALRGSRRRLRKRSIAARSFRSTHAKASATCGWSTRCYKRSRCCASSRNVGRWLPRTRRTRKVRAEPFAAIELELAALWA